MTAASEKITAHIESLILKSDVASEIHTLTSALCMLNDSDRQWAEHFEAYRESYEITSTNPPE